MHLSVVIPIHNEIDNIAPLLSSLEVSLKDITHEIILVDDGSTDETVSLIKTHQATTPHLRLIEFTRNYGQTAAISAGIEAALGDYIVTMDGDLQNDPKDIPAMLTKLIDDKLDLLAGIRKNRQDGLWLRKIPSRIANWLIGKCSGVALRDYGCTLKIFRASLAKQLDLYGELHRFIPILAALDGAKMDQIPVAHHPRTSGTSHYGFGRMTRVVSDLLWMLFMLRYRHRPMHLFGTMGISLVAAGSLAECYLLATKLMGNDIGDRPLFYVGLFSIIAGIQLITAGFLAELLIRIYHQSGYKKTYRIKETTRAKSQSNKA